MRLVVAVLEPSQVDTVRQALSAVHVTRLTICDSHGYDLAAADGLAQEAILEIAVNEDFLDRTRETLVEAMAALGPDAGRVFVLPVAEAIQIYRDVRGPEAV